MRAAALASACVALALAAAGAAAPPRVHLPRDHAAHPGAGIEWWYVTGLVHGSDGHRYTVFYTVFRRGTFLLPISQVVDLASGRIVGHTETLARSTSENGTLDLGAGGLSFSPGRNTWTFQARGGGYALRLSARPEKPYVLHGGMGYIRQSSAGLSAYYSATRMAASGTIHGSRGTVRFTGTAWLDHQWGNFVSDPRAFNWDWFSCRFDDRTELMLYRFRTRDGRPLQAYRSGTFVPVHGRPLRLGSFSVAPGPRALDAAAHRWPLDWRLRVPAVHLDLRLRSLARNQLFRGTVVPTFWEGASSATGTKQGYCFVEETYR